jgi:hypothetical protein
VADFGTQIDKAVGDHPPNPPMGGQIHRRNLAAKSTNRALRSVLRCETTRSDDADAQLEADMADDAIKVLEQALEASKREGYAEGFAAAMQLVRDFATSASATEHDTPRASNPVKTRPKAVRGRYFPRIPAAIAIKMVESAYESISPRAAGPAEIRRIVKAQNETDLPETSVRRSIDHLEAHNKIRRIAGTKTWVYEASAEAGGGGTKGERSKASSSAPRGLGNGAAPMHP